MIMNYIGIIKQESEPDAMSLLDKACITVGINLNLDINKETVEVDVKIGARNKLITFIEFPVENSKEEVDKVIEKLKDEGIACYFGDVHYRTPWSFVFKKSVIISTSTGDIKVDRSFIDQQCGLEFPTGNFSTSGTSAIFKSLDAPLPLEYNDVLDRLKKMCRFIHGDIQGKPAVDYTTKISFFLAAATAVYPKRMMWRGGIVPSLISGMLDDNVHEGNALLLMNRDDVDRLGLSSFAGVMEDKNRVECFNDIIVESMVHVLRPRSDREFGRGILGINAAIAEHNLTNPENKLYLSWNPGEPGALKFTINDENKRNSGTLNFIAKRSMDDLIIEEELSGIPRVNKNIPDSFIKEMESLMEISDVVDDESTDDRRS
jgi:hypothetical protein